MADNQLLPVIQDYIDKTPRSVLATVTKDNIPAIRTIGSFTREGIDIYFYTRKSTAKYAQIKANPVVVFYFQHENQEASTFKNVVYTGKAQEIQEGDLLQRAIAILSKRPKFKELAAKGELDSVALYRVEPLNIKLLDYGKSITNETINEISFADK
jgi:uncharacterized pyridoxamine 5'-phosphate oxidase family protein